MCFLKLTNVGNEYDYSWEESELYSFLSKNYMFNRMEISLSDDKKILIEKYNIFGSTKKNKLLNIYECNGKTQTPLHTIPFQTIKEIKIIK